MVAPNKAVQLILACIRKPELHQRFIFKEGNLAEGDISAIMFLGTNNILALASKFNEVKYDLEACLALIDDTYARLPTAIFEATLLDSSNVLTFIRCLTALEKANGVKITNPPINKNTPRYVPKPAVNICYDNCLFDLDGLTEEEKRTVLGTDLHVSGLEDDQTPDPLDDYKLKQLNLANCCCFPIISPRLVESLGQAYGHALWKSKNLGIIAPLNVDTWVKLAGITPEEVKRAYHDADNLIRKVDKMEVDLPFTTAFFGKECEKGDGFLMGQKDHMAKPDEKRNDFYIKKIWRTHCPYIKCNCQKYTRKKNDCMDGGIKWFDHAIWYLMNNLEAVWPTLPATARFVHFNALLRTDAVRTAVIAYIGFLRVRGLLFDMTKRYAEDPTADLNMEFGNTKLTEVLEKTIRPIKFLIGRSPSNSGRFEASTSKRKLPMLAEDIDILLPPSVYKKPVVQHTPNSHSIIDISDSPSLNGGVEGSVTKNNNAASSSRTDGIQGNKIVF